MAARISGLAVAYTAAGFVLLWSGYKNTTLRDTLTSLAGGKVPAGHPTGAPEIGLATAGSSASSGSPAIPPSGHGTISYQTAEMYWIAAGGPSGVAATAAAIAEAESSLNVGAVQQGQPYATTGWGLWQITPGNSEPQIATDQGLLSGLANARAAVAKYRAAGDSFSPWTTFTDGAYRQYLK